MLTDLPLEIKTGFAEYLLGGLYEHSISLDLVAF